MSDNNTLYSIDDFYTDIAENKPTAKSVNNMVDVTGDLMELTNIDSIIKSIYSLFLIPSETYFMDSKFGIGLHKYIFEPQDTTTQTNIISEISDKLQKYESRASISPEIYFYNNKKGYQLNITISYSGETRKLKISYDDSLLTTID